MQDRRRALAEGRRAVREECRAETGPQGLAVTDTSYKVRAGVLRNMPVLVGSNPSYIDARST